MNHSDYIQIILDENIAVHEDLIHEKCRLIDSLNEISELILVYEKRIEALKEAKRNMGLKLVK
ncbi:MAG: hypothetical protein WDA59_05070 [Methanofastidiosum sp.]|jgi:hypothetical protein